MPATFNEQQFCKHCGVGPLGNRHRGDPGPCLRARGLCDRCYQAARVGCRTQKTLQAHQTGAVSDDAPSRLSDEEVAYEFAHFRLFGYSRKAIARKLRISPERLPVADAA